MIDHDLTHDETPAPVPFAELEPAEIENRRTEFLNLQTLYGDGPASEASRALYAEDGMSFRLGAALPNSRVFDVPLDRDGKPLTADARNIENTVVRQLTAMFLQLHNLAVQESLEDDGSGSGRSPSERFAQARARVCHQFQWLVRHDFLPRICDEPTSAMVLRGDGQFIEWERDQFSIPVEFAQAAFRFGHSAVKHKYRLRGNREVGLADLFGGRGSLGPLQPSDAVDWAEFLGVGGNRQFAHLIDTAIVHDLFRVPERSIAAFASRGSDDTASAGMLPLRTLRRGAASRLCSGEVAAACLLPPDRASRAAMDCAHLRQCGFDGDTPLFYYILLEAELHERGRRLGSVGSRIVAGTLEGVLIANPASFVHQPPGWRPKPWRAPDGSEVHINTLYDVVRVVGLG